MTRGSRVDFAVNSLITRPKIIVFYRIVKIIPISPDWGVGLLTVKGLWLYVAEPPVVVRFFVVAEPFAGLVKGCYDQEPDDVNSGKADAEVRWGREGCRGVWYICQ